MDVSDDRMWLDPDVTPLGSRIYFNAVVTDTSGTSPNVGALGSRMIPPTVKFSAWLGIWKDCNRDGYIGNVESALFEYDPVLLTDPSVCPPGSRWNHHGWVGEFIHIGPRVQPNPAFFPRMLTDPDARVWGDFDRPDIPPQPDVSCLNAPLRRGTLDSTGALILMVDCNVNYNVARYVNEVDGKTHQGLAFDGEGGHYRPDNDCDHPLNVQLDLYGDSPCNTEDPGLFEGHTGRRMFSVWDCAAAGQEKFLDVRDPTAPPGERGSLSSVADPQGGGTLVDITDEDGTYGYGFLFLQVDNGNPLRPSLDDPDGSLADSLSHTSDGMGPCAGVEGDDGIGEPLTNGDIILDPLSGKRNQDFTFSFAVANNTGAACVSTLCSVCAVPGTCVAGLMGSAQGPENDGVRGLAGAPWKSSESYGPPTGFPNGVVRRADLKPASQTYFTFYARLGITTLASGSSAPVSTAGVYGGPACGTFSSGVHGGWDCDPAHWYNTGLGGNTPNANSQRVRSSYHLIDTDCYDGNIGGGTGLFASVAMLSEDAPCPWVS
jgi:hypothetical protein